MTTDRTFSPAPVAGTLDTLLREERVFRPMPRIVAEANMNPQDIAQARTHAESDWLGFWEEAAEELSWFRKWDNVLDDSDAPFYRWFAGARCNIVYNALDRHIETGNKNKLALIWEGEPGDTRKLTYYELYRAVNKAANALRQCGVQKGDRVLIHMPPLPETLIAMLASAKIGAVHTVVFGGFSARSLRDRINDARPAAIITVDGFYRNGRVVLLKSMVDKALSLCNEEATATLKNVVVVHRALVETPMTAERDLWYHDITRDQPDEALTESVDSTHPLFILYTSGTTGAPKGIVHAHGGYMVGVNKTLDWVFDLKPTDIFWCTADPAWITGHSYVVYGPLMAGTTTLMYEGHPLYPEAGRLWAIVERWGVTVLYTVPTLIRMLMRFGKQTPEKHVLSTLRLLGSVGEPISPEAWTWFHKYVGRSRCPVLDTWWQTETGMFMISPLPVSLLKPGSVTKPLPGIEADVVDSDGNSVPSGRGGYLVIKKPWPAMLSAVFNDPEAYKRLYWEKFPGWYFAGDVARKDEDGYLWIQGRADDVMLIAGHRIGTAELEAALASHPAVAECAVIGVPDDIRGEVAKAYVVLHDDQPSMGGMMMSGETDQDLINHARRELGPVAVIREVVFRESLPKNKNGKIMRRILRAEEAGEDTGDTSTLEDVIL
ncbi:acetate--CoA ligase [Oleidesulfovibrio sp.]|uniref:acetate--CoA ligase n=1 Tax=Oleidesulfovibrio sp. TaxID=2909707 RepID=UPI003A8A52DD